MGTPDDPKTSGTINKANEALKKYIKSQKVSLETTIKMNEAAATNKSALNLQIEARTKEVEQAREYNKEMVARLAQLDGLVEGTEEYTNKQKIIAAQDQARLRNLEEMLETTGKLTTAEREEYEILSEIGGAWEDLTPAAIKAGMAAKEATAAAKAGLNDADRAAQDLGAAFGDTAAGILGIDKNWNQAGLTGKMLNAVHKGSNLTTVFGLMKDNVLNAVNPVNLLASGIIGMVKGVTGLTKALDASFGEFKQSTGGGDEYLDVLSDVTGENYAFGISSDEAMQSVKSLYLELAMFSRMSKEAQTELADTSAKLQALGVDAQSSAEAADILMQSVGYTKDEFIEFEQSLKSMSNEIGVPMEVLHSQFKSGAQIVAQYGKGGVAEFKKLAAAAKATGIEMSSLLDIVGQFDTFEEASDHVGSLNAILGGAYLDTVQMVKASEEDRVDMLRKTVQASGKVFGDLEKYERKAIAAAAGITDMNEANKLFGTSNAVYAELQMLASDASMSLADLSEEAYNTLSPMEKFEAVLKKMQKPLGLLLKFLDLIATGLYWVVEGFEKVEKAVGATGATGTILTMVLMKLAFVVASMAKGAAAAALTTGSLGTAAAAAAGPLAMAGAAVVGFAKFAAIAALGIGALGLAFMAVGTGIAWMGEGVESSTRGISNLITNMEGLSDAGVKSVSDLAGNLRKFKGIEVPVTLTNFTKALGSLTAETVKVTPASAAAVEKIFKETATLAAVTAGDNTTLVEAIAGLVKATNQATASSTAAGQTKTTEFKLDVYLDGKKMWKGVRPHATREFLT